MKNTVKKITFSILTLISVAAFAEKEDKTCANSAEYEKAQKAKTEYEAMLNSIPGVVKIEIETCAANESFELKASESHCGVFIWFDSEEKKDVFFQTTALGGGKVQTSTGALVPLCAKTVQQIMSNGPY